jgi:hypothetical protein
MKRSFVFISLFAGFTLVACSGRTLTKKEENATSAKNRASGNISLTSFVYTQIYADANGETHFREINVALVPTVTAPPAQAVNVSAEQPATTTRFAAFEPHWGDYDRKNHVFHTISSRRLISVISGNIWVKTSDGETRQFKSGDVFEALDTLPAKGHTTWVGDEPALALYSNHQ